MIAAVVEAAATAEAVGFQSNTHTHMYTHTQTFGCPLLLACQRRVSPGSQLADDATYQQLLCLTPPHTDRVHEIQNATSLFVLLITWIT